MPLLWVLDMKQKKGIPFSERWKRRRLFVMSLLCITLVLTLDLMTIFSFDSFPNDIAILTDSQEIYSVFEEWYAYIGRFFSLCFYVILLGCMCVVFLLNAWENRFQLIPALLIWCSSLGVLSSLGEVGGLLTAARPNTFSKVAEGLGQLSFLPLFLCMVYYMRRCNKLFAPLVLSNCFCSSALLLSLAWGENPGFIYVTKSLSDDAFLVSFVAVIVFSVWECIKKNDNFRSFIPLFLFSVFIFTAFRVFVVLLQNGFVLSRVYAHLASITVTVSYLRNMWLEGILYVVISLMIVVNYLRQYHQHTLQLQGIRLRNEANLDYARSLQRYESSVRKIKHDVSNTLNVALMLCKNGEYDQLQEYLGTMGDRVSNIRSGNYCSHILANYILLMFEERFADSHTEFRCKATLPADVDLPDADLAGELNNILQNALDAVQKLPLEQRWVEITVCMEKNVLRINCRNPYQGKLKAAKDGLLESDKSNREDHGFGLQIIYEIAEKHGGVAVPLFGDGIFEIKVALPIGLLPHMSDDEDNP